MRNQFFNVKIFLTNKAIFLRLNLSSTTFQMMNISHLRGEMLDKKTLLLLQFECISKLGIKVFLA